MPLRTKVQVALTIVLALAAIAWAAGQGSHGFLPFFLLLAASILSAGFLVKLPKSDGSMSVNFPFILMGLMVLSPVQAFLLAGLSVIAQSFVRVSSIFAAVQILFNVTNAVLATVCAYGTYAFAHRHMASAPALALASVAYFLWNTGTFAAIIAPSKGERIHTLWLAEFPWYLPFYLIGATLAALTTWLAERFGWSTAVMLIPAVYTLYRTYMGQLARLRERQHHLEETEALHLRIIEGLAMAIEAKDQNTHDHLFRVRNYGQAVGKAIGLDKLELQALQTASFLHDIGKLAVPEHILNKPGKLTQDEFEKMKIHPSVGAEIMERVRFPYPVVPIVRSHHEWWNGAGYPDGLKGEEIPIGARVLTVVDCFDALVSDRPYRKGMSDAQALDIIRSLAGRQFDPTIVEAFVECHAAEQFAHAEPAHHTPFTPLNTEPQVWRGLAPGAGFEAGSDENAPARISDGLCVNAFADSSEEVALLVRTAAAREQAQSFFEMSQACAPLLTLDDSLRVLSTRLNPSVPHDACALYLKRGDNLHIGSVVGEAAPQFAPVPIALGAGVSGWVAQRGKPLLNGNVAAEPGCPCLPNGTSVFHSALSFPLFNPQQQLFAVLTMYARAGDSFQKDHLRILQAMASKLSLALENALESQAKTRDADTDFSTGLPNARRLYLQLEAELERCRRSNSVVAITSCNLNIFQEISQRRGQLASNRLLSTISEELRRSLKGQEFVARLGGDEFVFIAPALDQPAAERRLKELVQQISATARHARPGPAHGVGFGTALFPIDGTSAETLLAVANRRMQVDGQRLEKAASARPHTRAEVIPMSA